MSCARVLVVLAVAVAPVAAQPVACDACDRGDAVIKRFSLELVRPLAGTLAALTLDDPLTPDQYARVIEVRGKTPALVRIGAVDDADLALVAAALCRAKADPCAAATTRALRCLADRCAVALPESASTRVDLVPNKCLSSSRKRSPPLGVGIDWGNGWHSSRNPNDGHAWSLGIATRLRIGSRFGAVARIDRMAGRDAAEDMDGNGVDDVFTGSITRISALAGPSIVLDFTNYKSTARFLQLDLLGGYLATRSQPDENGPAAGFDLVYQLWAIRAGVRVVQAFGDARDATTVLAHLGFVSGGAPEYTRDTNCSGGRGDDRSSRLALGFDIPIGGYGISSELGYLSSGLGFEAVFHLTRSLDAVARADILLYPAGDRDRVIHQAVLGGFRIDYGSDTERSVRLGFFSTVLYGYSHAAGISPTAAGAGGIADISLGWGAQGHDGAGWVALHTRFGFSEDNVVLRLFLSIGFELRFDRRHWRSRV